MSHKEIVPDGRFQHRQAPHEHFLFEGIDYPVSRQDLVDIATDAEYDPDTLNLVRSLPDRTFESREDVWRAIGEATRRFASGARDLGEPRDDIGKQTTVRPDGSVARP